MQEDDSDQQIITYFGQQQQFDGTLSLSFHMSKGHYFLSILLDPDKEKATAKDDEKLEKLE